MPPPGLICYIIVIIMAISGYIGGWGAPDNRVWGFRGFGVGAIIILLILVQQQFHGGMGSW